MAVRKIVRIDEELCNGCGLCVPSCAEGAIRIVNGKARLIGENLCDGLGACLGDCPQGAITVEEREADAYDERAVHAMKSSLAGYDGECACGGHETQPPRSPVHHSSGHHGGGCPGAAVRDFGASRASDNANSGQAPSQLRQWPVQLHLLPPTAPFLRGADLVLAADCAAFAMGDFHNRFLRGKALAIACPKLDSGLDVYLDKLTQMIDLAGLDTITVVIMEVPCCVGLLALASRAIAAAERRIPLKMVRVGLRGDILEERWVQA